MSHHKFSFNHIANPNAKILILGSIPGDVSIAADQYYAHPRNLFWDFMQQLLDIPRELAYEQRIQLLQSKGIALWDVLGFCHREGSLDSSIDKETEQPNAISELLEACPGIQAVFFNGQKAQTSFKRHILKLYPGIERRCELIVLPSTSPANASIKVQDKLESWKRILEFL
ncbi:MAG: DNA-deoxyinosine glycosylase [Gammaproteobacteria bacterium]|nr:MAG: DNA-deoxyinosine glycosylase [Gammaproteobacteria bacterium]